MKKFYSFLLALFFFNGLIAQTQNALDFDGIDDQVIVPNGGALISSGTGISLGMWVYPRNAAPGFPNFDCFGGFRNNLDADFYMIQIGPNTVEARFRNSVGTNYDIIFSGLLLNTWQHFVFMYDGSQTKLFHNGIEVGSSIASGSITNASETFYVGNGLYQGTEFTMDGKADEIVLFDRMMTAQEINCLYRGSVDTTASGLKLFYNCNQGVADGNNAGLTNLPGLSTQPAGTLANFALSGTGSNWVSGMNFIGTASGSFCQGDVFEYANVEYGVPGNFLVTIPGSGGCDSTVSLTITENLVDTAVSRNNTLLSTSGTADFYQWVNCASNYTSIVGANQASFNVTVDGSYAVIIIEGTCVDTSRCIAMSVEGLLDRMLPEAIKVYPVPANDVLVVEANAGRLDRIEILDPTGRLVLRKEENAGQKISLDVSELPSGFYLVNTYQKGLLKGVARFNKL
jgi:hypothetical protein